MSRNIDTREFSISDYDGALQVWQRVEGVEIAEGGDREGVARLLMRNRGLSRVGYAGTTDVVDTFIIWPLIPHISGADSVSVCWMNASMAYAGLGCNALLSWWLMTTSAAPNSGNVAAGRRSPARSRWELMFRS